MLQPKTAEQRNATVIHELYASAEATAKDTPKFVSMFAKGGYFYDVGAGKKYYGPDIGYTAGPRIALDWEAQLMRPAS